MENGKVIYICENTPDGVFTAIYDAWAARIPDERLSILADGEFAMELFAEYRYVETDMAKRSLLPVSFISKPVVERLIRYQMISTVTAA